MDEAAIPTAREEALSLRSGDGTALAATEPDAGSDLTALKTTARRDGNGYVLNGKKAFITNAPVADLFTVMARTDESDPGAGGVSAFIVERDSPGLRTGAPYKKMGQEGAQSGHGLGRNLGGSKKTLWRGLHAAGRKGQDECREDRWAKPPGATGT